MSECGYVISVMNACESHSIFTCSIHASATVILLCGGSMLGWRGETGPRTRS